ncbi:MAG: hypothetical protein M1148_02800 [Candidatus Thermoplasmatota archaeon]|nr:hypothetical protein [Candidatus Thermoplasmatota archaeon]
MEIINMGGQISSADFGQFSVGVYTCSAGYIAFQFESVVYATHEGNETKAIPAESVLISDVVRAFPNYGLMTINL